MTRQKRKFLSSYKYGFVLAAAALVVWSACCNLARDPGTIKLVVAGQTLIKIDPRQSWEKPFGSIRPIIQSADVGFTNFEMAVNGQDNQCNVPQDYVLVLGEPRISRQDRPGNTSNPHAVQVSVMEFLSSMGFNLMSLANNHIWDLGECGVEATRAAAKLYGVTYAGAGGSVEEAVAPAYLKVRNTMIALVAATTSHDEKDLLTGEVNGVWTGHQDDWDRNIAAVEEASRNADVVIFYQHFQIDVDEFAGLRDGESTEDGHIRVDDVKKWQEDFAKAVIDAGASVYIGHGHRGFDGIEIYKGRPLLRQLGGFAYQGLNPNIGNYDVHFAWWGLLANMTISGGSIQSIQMIPLDIDEGGEYVGAYSTVEFLTRRGFAEVATGTLATEILERFRTLSEEYGTEVKIKGERAFIDLSDTD